MSSCSFRIFGEPAVAFEAKFFRERLGRVGKFAAEKRNLSVEQNRNRDRDELRVDRRQRRRRRAGRRAGVQARSRHGIVCATFDCGRHRADGGRRRRQRGQGQQRHEQLLVCAVLKLSPILPVCINPAVHTQQDQQQQQLRQQRYQQQQQR